jgi:hypothetical protein
MIRLEKLKNMIYKIGYQRETTESTSDFVEGLYNEYVPDNSLIVFDRIDCNIDAPDYISHVIFDAAINPVDIEQSITNVKLDKCHIITGLYSYYKKQFSDPRIKFFPFWAVWSSSPHTGKYDMRNHRFQDCQKKYKVSCLNGSNWNHRKLTYIELSKKPYFNDMIFSFKNRPVAYDVGIGLNLTIEDNDQFSRLPPEVKFISDDTNGIDLTIDHAAYRETYINLVTETTISAVTPMLSEKTFKPIVAGQLFVLIASPGAVQFLRDIGIDTFDDIIDHTYDTVLDDRTRIYSAIQQIDRLTSLDLAEIYNQIKPRLLRNSEFLKSSEFKQQFPLTFD